jgi:predicted nucleic acid-binding protein
MTTIVVDANLALSYVIPLPYSQLAMTHFDQWAQAQARLVVPVLWRYEVLSGLRKAISMKMLTLEQAITSFKTLQDMDLEEIPSSEKGIAEILGWAERLHQVVAYDAVYLALSEQIGAEFWTADRRLANAAHAAGADWVHLLRNG